MIRSPLFYVGDKYKLVKQLLELFPKEISIYVEPFYGGGSSALQVKAETYLFNDIDKNIIRIHEFLKKEGINEKHFFDKLYSLIEYYGLSCSYLYDIVPKELKIKYPKTYYSKFNKIGYNKMRDDYNNEGQTDDYKLYLLLIYGFNHMIRFNSKGDFNLPVGNVDFNNNVHDALINYFKICTKRAETLSNLDYRKFIKNIKLDKKSFIYLDPPYFISMSEYNKIWNEADEKELYNLLDNLNEKGLRFGITNLLVHKGKTNRIFQEWSKKYTCKVINSNYISFNDNSIKKESVELYVYNY